MYRSPVGPPFVPGSPCPLMRSRVPESTPAGTPTSSVRSRSMRPCPRHETHASRIVCPAPWHAGHVRVIEKNPCWYDICPRPPHVWHVVIPVPDFAPVPLQLSQLSKRV